MPNAEHPASLPLRHDRTEPLWRVALGRRLRRIRTARQQTLAETATRAGVSAQYLSEVERGRKEPSSEMIAAIAGALGTSLAQLTAFVTLDLRGSASAPAEIAHEHRRAQPARGSEAGNVSLLAPPPLALAA
jgi:transcriptional regulator with XRE-family HTH domain